VGEARRRIVRDYWDGCAADYDLAPDHGLMATATRAAWKNLLHAWLPRTPAIVADLACGTGSLAQLCAELGHTVRAFDLSGEMVARAREKNIGHGERVAVHVADVSAPPLSPASVDVVLARHVLWTLPDPHSALEAWVAAVAPGGRLLLVEGRWSASGARPGTSEVREEGMPWDGGVTARELRSATAPLVARAEVHPLTDPLLWGRAITDERYLLVADVAP